MKKKSGEIGINTIIDNMKYLEEINTGDCFIFENKYFVLTSDFKKNGNKLAVSLKNGSCKWIKSDAMIDPIDIFTFDENNNIIAIKERQKDAAITNTNIS